MNAPRLYRWETMTKEEKDLLVTDLTQQGLSAREIGERLGCSRNCIVGFWNRNQTPGRAIGFGGKVARTKGDMPGAIAARLEKQRQKELRRARDSAKRVAEGKPPVEPKKPVRLVAPARAVAPKPPMEACVVVPFPVEASPAPVPEIAHGNGPMPFLSRGSLQCAWVVDGRGPDGLALCCGAHVHKLGSSYCEAHHSRSWVRVRPYDPKAKAKPALVFDKRRR